MFKFLRKKTISVHLIDDSTSDPIGSHELLPADLPDSLDPFTVLHIGTQDWELVYASPAKQSQYLKSRKLTLFVVPPGHPHPDRVQFSSPTLSNDLPASSEGSSNGLLIELHADDWRQIEFLPRESLPAIHEEMAAVEALLHPRDGSSPSTWRQIHVRRLDRRQLNLDFEAVCQALSITDIGQFSFAKSGIGGHVAEGFALQSDRHVFYGTRQDDRVKELGFVFLGVGEIPAGSVQDLMQKYGLVLVDWPHAKIFGIPQ